MNKLNFKTVSKYFLYTLLAVVFISCTSESLKADKFYTYKVKIQVTYSDGTKDTIFDTVNLTNNRMPMYRIKVTEPTFFGSEKIVPSLNRYNTWRNENLATGVRSFNIIYQTKKRLR